MSGDYSVMHEEEEGMHLTSTENTIPSGATCRICRGEATESNPLFHPCKCKGSIKYLHEPCLLEWISARNLDINKPGSKIDCDICHYPFQFKTTYADTMPETIPLAVVIKNSLWNYILKLYSTSLLVLASLLITLGVPLIWNFFGKLCTFIIDSETPYPDQFWKSILFGFNNNKNNNEPFVYSVSSIVILVLQNIKFSVFQIALVIILHLALYFQYDMIVREDVFSKMVFHKIGPNFSIADLKKRLKERFPMMDDSMLEQVAKMMREREKVEHEQRLDQEERDFQHEFDLDVANVEQDQQLQEHLPQENGNENEQRFQAQEFPDENEDEDPDYVLNENDNHNDTDSDSENSLHRDDDGEVLDFNGRQQDFEDDLFAAPAIRPVRPPQPFPVEPIVADAAPAAPEVQPNNNNLEAGIEVQLQNEANDLQQVAPIVANINLKFSNIILYLIIADVVIATYIFMSYLFPTVVGFLLIEIYVTIATVFGRGLARFFYLSRANIVLELIANKFPYSRVIYNWVLQYIVTTIIFYYDGYKTNSLKNYVLIRALPAFTTYITAIAIICIASEYICKGYGRRNGMTNNTRRFVFQILFAIRCTFKVFTLFFIELAGFPVLAGIMLDISLISPILSKSNNWLWVTQICTFWPQTAFILYWIIGTLYMYWFAKYIGMIRQYIIRPGVLFFIRSPEDPNIKILHDSLIHPMGIQLSRLCLSMFIYAVFILVGFGIHTKVIFPHVLKTNFIVSHEAFNNTTLVNVVTMFVCFNITKNVIEENPNVKSLVRDYWMEVFQIISRKLRLSSFILGKDYSLERGHVQYRNYFYKYFAPKTAQWSNPDLFSNPKTTSQARQLFKENKLIHAYFIPDGMLMRVPSSDVVSRNYVQTMFVPVTKNDKLLKPLDLERAKERNKRNAGEFGYLDHQNTDFDDYFVCYVPPHFKFRYITLIALTWLFSSLLIIMVAAISQYLFNTLTLIVLPVLWILGYQTEYTLFKDIISGSYKQVNLQYVCLGAVILSLMIDYYKEHQLSKYLFQEHRVEEQRTTNNDDVASANEEDNNEINVDAPPAAPVHRPRIAAVIFESWFMKFLTYDLLVAIFVSMRGLFGFIISYLFAFSLSYWLFNLRDFFSDKFGTKPLLMLTTFINAIIPICNPVAYAFAFVGCVRGAAGVPFIPNQNFTNLVKGFWKKHLHDALYSLTLAAAFAIVIVGGCVVSEYSFNFTKYKSLSEAAQFVKLGDIQNEAFKKTLSIHIHSIVISLVSAVVFIRYILMIAQSWFGKTVQDVKDQVYARGRSLENYSLSNQL